MYTGLICGARILKEVYISLYVLYTCMRGLLNDFLATLWHTHTKMFDSHVVVECDSITASSPLVYAQSIIVKITADAYAKDYWLQGNSLQVDSRSSNRSM